MKTALRPIIHRREYDNLLLSEVQAFLDDAIFRPVLDLLDSASTVRLNASQTPLAAALSAGRINYSDGHFSGVFDAETSRELRRLGAKKTRDREGAFVLALALLPSYLIAAAHSSAARTDEVHQQIRRFAEEAQINLATLPPKIDAKKALDIITRDLQLQVSQTVQRPKAEAGETQIPPADLTTLETDLTTQLELHLAQQSADALAELLRQVAENVAQGGRADQLRRRIERVRTSAKRGTKVEVESSLGVFVAGVRQSVYGSRGIVQYVWRTQRDERVRHGHQLLEGGVFSFSSPPVENPRTGNRANPGEAPNCRCYPLPLINLADLAA